MIREYLRYQIDADRRDAFIAAYRAGVGPLLASPYALAFDMAQCVEDPTQFILRIDWTSAEDHLKSFAAAMSSMPFLPMSNPMWMISSRCATIHRSLLNNTGLNAHVPLRARPAC